MDIDNQNKTYGVKLKKIFFHNEAIIKRGHPIINFFIVTKVKQMF